MAGCILYLYCSFMFDDAGIVAVAVAKSSLVNDCWLLLWLVALALVAMIVFPILFIRVFVATTVIELVDALEWSFLTPIIFLWSSSTAWFLLSSPLEHLEQLLVECRWLLSTIPFNSFVQFTVFQHSFIWPSTASSVVTGAFVPGEGIKCSLYKNVGELSERSGDECKKGVEQHKDDNLRTCYFRLLLSIRSFSTL